MSRSELYDLLSRVEQARREVDTILWRFQAKGQDDSQDQDLLIDRDFEKLGKWWDAVPVEEEVRKLTRLTIPPFGPLMKMAVLMAFDSWIAGVPTDETRDRLLREAEGFGSELLENTDIEAIRELMSHFVDAAIEEIEKLQPSIEYDDVSRPAGQLKKALIQQAINYLVRSVLENPPF